MVRTSTRQRTRRVIHAGAALTSFLVVACSSFGSSTESPPVAPEEAGIDGGPPGADATTSCEAATDLTKDPKNCGKCGHSCEGGECTAGVCQPLELAQFTDQPVANVVLTSTHVFWNTMEDISGGPGNVYACLKGTCAGGATKLPNVGQTVVGLGSDGDQRAYGGALFGGGGLFEVGPASMSSKLSAAMAGNPVQMSLRTSEMFYLSFYDPGTATYGRTVRRWNYAGDVMTPCTFANENTSAGAFTSARAYLYANGVMRIHSCALAGGDGQFAEYRANVALTSLTTSADRVFWADSTGTVTSSPDGEKSSSLQTEIDPAKVGDTKVTSVTVSHGELFATTQGGELWSCTPGQPNACANTLRRLAQDGVLETFHTFFSHTVAADASAVYYVAVDGTPAGATRTSRLMKVAR